MSSINSASYGQSGIQALEQYLFKQIDADGDGSITKSELESAVSANGGSKQSADQLYETLDPKNAGSVSEQQFEQNLPGNLLDKEISSVLLQEQAAQNPPQLTDITSQIPGAAAAGLTVKEGPISAAFRDEVDRVSHESNDGGADALFSLVDPASTEHGTAGDAGTAAQQLGAILKNLTA
ncbi:hypothetical protein GCM10011611_47960 [Aliidongia dinghuensis]|uniref:EF-hand domain-containing protein n=1 Tax=Aliidongia dinghuensis TaxID=1867774 RepID=A0A8J3E5I1_9PROT|nr:EF-hand domain-containing protein [Aliidongia dinghuensis]GGF35995.1 hypothetical protein GCM10011611_47960 [Aliidongia dinghuensis]